MATGRYANEAVCKWSQALTTQNGCVLYLCAGLLGVYLVSRGRMTTGQLGLVLLVLGLAPEGGDGLHDRPRDARGAVCVCRTRGAVLPVKTGVDGGR